MPDTEHFKNRLLQLQQQHAKRIKAIDKDIRHEGMTADWSEQATERENDEVLESLGNVTADELIKIKQALKRLESGDYFYCSECGEEIPEARLDLLPFTTLCVACAEKQER